jgi:hypothetical protein
MSDDEIPDNEWDTEVRIRSLQGEDEEEVRAEVIRRYLDVCDPRPLVSAILRGRPIGATTKRHLAAVFDPEPRTNEPVPSSFGVRPSHGRLREFLKPVEADWVRVLLAGHAALSEGRSAPPAFWEGLAKGLRRGHPKHWIGPPPEFPIQIRLQFRAQNHRPTDPSLNMRNRALRWFVDEAVEGGLTREAAIEDVAEKNGLSARTVKRAVYGG